VRDFSLNDGPFSSLLKTKGITTFRESCDYIAALPYGRNSQRVDLTSVISEEKGTCSSKHGFLGRVLEENRIDDIHLIAGIFLMSPETHPVLSEFFKGKRYTSLPEMHCYLRSEGERYDYTTSVDRMPFIAPKIIREQRIEPHQTVDWKVKIHQEYIKAWLLRNPQIEISFRRSGRIGKSVVDCFRDWKGASVCSVILLLLCVETRSLHQSSR